jgi:ribulose-phosphate 3-epimerase
LLLFEVGFRKHLNIDPLFTAIALRTLTNKDIESGNRWRSSNTSDLKMTENSVRPSPNNSMNRTSAIGSLRGACPAILPSLLLCDFAHLAEEVERLEDAGVEALHLDVMDGVFVPNFTYGITVVNAINRITDLPLDVHLMMVNPEKYIKQFIDAGSDVLTVHAEATADLVGTLEMIRQAGAAPGIAINPATAVSAISSAIPHADLVLVMSVQAGFGGQAFDSSVLSKFSQIRECSGGANVLLEIDGGINSETIGTATESGAQLLVAGSAIFNHPDYAQAISAMMSRIKC